MRHLTNFWLRTADAIFDDDYARYVDYVGRAHTSRGADPRIYIAERYVIGQVGFLQHAITEILVKELYVMDEVLTIRAQEAWSKFMMVLLEMLSRAYNPERMVDQADALLAVDREQIERLAAEAFEIEHGEGKPITYKRVTIAGAGEIPDGERKIVKIDGLSIGVFHHNGKWYALRNSCLHRGGPVCTGTLEDDTLTCPWHGFQYDVIDGRLLVDPAAHLDTYPIFLNAIVVPQVPDLSIQPCHDGSPAASTHGGGEGHASQRVQNRRCASRHGKVRRQVIERLLSSTQQASSTPRRMSVRMRSPLCEGTLRRDHRMSVARLRLTYGRAQL
jgi:nitrite reductase/ring-hydroxylating ferredoxin subunit